jgi:hypothetical protein
MMKLVLRLMVCVALAAPATASAAQTDKHPTNACLCYKMGDSCMCKHGAKCGCPGECEPKGCEEERQKKFQKEIEEEARKAKEEDKVKNKPKEEAKGEDEEGKTDGKGKDKGKAAKKMTKIQKKQLQTLLEAYLTDNQDSGNLMLTELLDSLKKEQ